MLYIIEFYRILILEFVAYFIIISLITYTGILTFLLTILLCFTISLLYLTLLGMSYYTILVYFIYLTIFPVFFIYTCTFLGLLIPIYKYKAFQKTSISKKVYIFAFIFIIWDILMLKAFLYTHNISLLKLSLDYYFGYNFETINVFLVLFNIYNNLSLSLGGLLFIVLVSLLYLVVLINKNMQLIDRGYFIYNKYKYFIYQNLNIAVVPTEWYYNDLITSVLLPCLMHVFIFEMCMWLDIVKNQSTTYLLMLEFKHFYFRIIYIWCFLTLYQILPTIPLKYPTDLIISFWDNNSFYSLIGQSSLGYIPVLAGFIFYLYVLVCLFGVLPDDYFQKDSSWMTLETVVSMFIITFISFLLLAGIYTYIFSFVDTSLINPEAATKRIVDLYLLISFAQLLSAIIFIFNNWKK